MKEFTQRKTNLARDLRNNATPAERKLWPYLSARKLDGVRFNRQVCIGPYVCDFAARTAKLVIELDGDSHSGQVHYDRSRTVFLEHEGYRVVRFANADVMSNVEGVVEAIGRVLKDRPSPNPVWQQLRPPDEAKGRQTRRWEGDL